MDAGVHDLLQRLAQANAAGRREEAAELAGRIIASDHDNPAAHFVLGLAALRADRISEADEHFRRVLIREPDSYEALHRLSQVCRRMHLYDEAVQYAVQATDVRPDGIEGYQNLGMSLLRMHRYKKALAAFERAAQFDDAPAGVFFQLGNAHRMLGEPERAEAAYRRALEADPRSPSFLVGLAQAELDLDKPSEAIRHADAALEREPCSTAAFNTKAQALASLGLHDEAEGCMLAALDVDEGCAESHLNLGMHLQFKGDLEAATRHLERALELDDTMGAAYHSLAQSHRFEVGDDPLLERMEGLVSRGTAPAHDGCLVRYALGKAYDDLGDYGTAMGWFDGANRIALDLSRASRSWDAAAHRYQRERTEQRYTSEFLQHAREGGDRSDLPVLVVGMIRSGTTLTEQVLTSHPRVSAGGEFAFWTTGHANPEQYIDLLRAKGPEADRVTDKFPTNYTAIGAIHAQLPNARFIHVRRNPIDTCLSIWTTHISRGPGFLHDRDNIVAAYREYVRYMDHWRLVIPSDRLLEIEYEELVSALEPTAKRMISFCGLDWDEACLTPERNARAVLTPSLWRVRQPVDRSSVEKWRRYEPWLGSFRELLDS